MAKPAHTPVTLMPPVALSAVAAATLAALSLPLHAQTAVTSTSNANSPTLKEVKVKASADGDYKTDKPATEKFVAPLIDTPQTVIVIKPELLQEQSATTLQEALRNTPGVTLLLGEGGNSNTKDNIFMRGFDSSSSIFTDGVRDLGNVTRDTFNLESIEVVKGASGSEYGRGVASGTINMVTKTPFADNYSEASLSVGTGQKTRVTADLNRKLTDSAAWRLNVMAQDKGVAGRDHVKNRGYAIAPSIAFGLGTDTRASLSLLHSKQYNRPDGGVPTIGLAGYYAGEYANERFARNGITNVQSVDPRNYYGSLSDYSRVDANQATLKLEHDLSPNTTLRNITRFGRTKLDQLITGTSNPSFNGNPGTAAGDTADAQVAAGPATWIASRSRQLRLQENDVATNQTSLSSQFNALGLEHSLNAGFEYLYEKQKTPGLTGAGTQVYNGSTSGANLYAPNANDPILNMNVQRTGQVSTGKATTLAAYVFDSMKVNSWFLLNAGVRFDRYDVKNDTITAPDANGNQTRTHIEGDGNLVSWKLGAVFKPASNGSIYASVSTSQQPPGGSNFTLSATEGNINNPNMDPSKATNYEVGTKWDLFDNRLAVTGAVFRTEVKNDLSTVDSVTGAVTQYGKKQVEGVEIGVTGHITPVWSISAGYAHMKTEVVAGTSSQTGASLNWSPKNSFTAWSTYKLPFGLTLGGGARYQDSLVRSVSNTAVAATTSMLNVPSYWVFDAYARYDFSKNTALQLNVYNLADKKYIASLNNNGGRYTPGEARNAMLTLTMKF